MKIGDGLNSFPIMEPQLPASCRQYRLVKKQPVTGLLDTLLLIITGHIFVTSPKLWAGDRILDRGTAEVKYSVSCPQLRAYGKNVCPVIINNKLK